MTTVDDDLFGRRADPLNHLEDDAARVRDLKEFAAGLGDYGVAGPAER